MAVTSAQPRSDPRLYIHTYIHTYIHRFICVECGDFLHIKHTVYQSYLLEFVTCEGAVEVYISCRMQIPASAGESPQLKFRAHTGD